MSSQALSRQLPGLGYLLAIAQTSKDRCAGKHVRGSRRQGRVSCEWGSLDWELPLLVRERLEIGVMRLVKILRLRIFGLSCCVSTVSFPILKELVRYVGYRWQTSRVTQVQAILFLVIRPTVLMSLLQVT